MSNIHGPAWTGSGGFQILRVGSGRVGSGRVGSGRVRSGRVGLGRVTLNPIRSGHGDPTSIKPYQVPVVTTPADTKNARVLSHHK